MSDEKKPLGENPNLGFSYGTRLSAVFAVTALAGVLWFRKQLADKVGTKLDLPSSVGFWRWVLLTAIIFSIVLALMWWRGPDGDRPKPIWLSDRGDAVWCALVRWLLLALVAGATTHLGVAARLPKGSPNILRLELAGSRRAAYELAVSADVVHDAIVADLLFIVAYVLMLGLLALWAGSYYRLGVMRDARKLVTYGVVAAGLLDCLEDLMMQAGISHWNQTSGWDVVWLVAAAAAWAKLLLLLVAVFYIVGGAHSWLVTPSWVRIASWSLSTHDGHRDVAAMRIGDRRGLGIALAGGGIRAASISLGALQSLEREDLGAPAGGLGWGAASAVTAVSGGSNMAAGWSISRSTYDGALGNPDRVPPEGLCPVPWLRTGDGDVTPEERHLLDNLGYLASSDPRGPQTDPASPTPVLAPLTAGGPGRASYRPTAYATVFVGLFINTLVLLAALFVVTQPAGWALRSLQGDRANVGGLSQADFHDLVVDHHLWTPGVVFLGLGVALLFVWVLAGQWLIRRAERSKVRRGLLLAFKSGAYAALAIGLVLALLLWAMPELAGWVAGIGTRKTSITSVAGGAGVLGSVLRILRKPAARFVPMLGGIVFGVLFLFLAAAWVATAARTTPTWSLTSWNLFSVWLLALVVLIGLQLTVSPERWSLAAFYRGKLRLAYATFRTKGKGKAQPIGVYRNDNAAQTQAEREPGLDAFTSSATFEDLKRNGSDLTGVTPTPLIVCATSTVSSRAVRTHYGIPALSVTFDPDHVTLYVPIEDQGVWRQYRASTALISKLGRGQHKRITTMLAVAISSAAVSPAMGRIRIGPTRMLLTFANIRLGVWMPNPRYATLLPATAPAQEVGYPRTGLGYLFKEFFGIHDLTDPFLYMTDGGHWENTGLVELLRRVDITEIVCVDADSGRSDATSSAGKAIDLAPLECGVKIHLDLDPLRAELHGTSAPDYAKRTVNLGFFLRNGTDYTRGDDVGVLWYSKPGLTKTMPDALLAFRETHADYPHTNTVNQFFDTSTFFAYRDLGRYNAQIILEARRQLVDTLENLLRCKPGPNRLRARLQKELNAEDCHWVVRELNRAVQSLGEADPVRFCRAVKTALQTP